MNFNPVIISLVFSLIVLHMDIRRIHFSQTLINLRKLTTRVIQKHRFILTIARELKKKKLSIPKRLLIKKIVSFVFIFIFIFQSYYLPWLYLQKQQKTRIIRGDIK